MTSALAICLEDLSETPSTYLQCVALQGRQPGLRVTAEGRVAWQQDEDVAFELWVSGDERLILYRPQGARPARVERAGRGLDAPEGKPVVLVSGDEVIVGERRLRVHIHGEAQEVAAPSWLPPRIAATVAAAATMVALGAAGVGCDHVDVRDHPPAVRVMPPPDAGDGTTPTTPNTPATTQFASPPPTATAAPTSTIEVRPNPPAVAVPRQPPPPPDKPPAGK